MKIVLVVLLLLSSFSVKPNISFDHPVKENQMIATNFGIRFHPLLKVERLHDGIDYKLPEGTKVYASSAGVVKSSGINGDFGNTIIIDHGNGFETSYSHLSNSATNIKPGLEVNQGDLIGLSGISGLAEEPLLHFSIILDGEAVNPIDYLEQE